LALKHGSSVGIGMREIIDTLAAFEAQNHITIKMRAELTETNGKRDFQFVAEAWSLKTIEQAPRILAYSKSPCLAKRLLTMEAVVFQLLYALDFQLALLELPKAKAQKA